MPVALNSALEDPARRRACLPWRTVRPNFVAVLALGLIVLSLAWLYLPLAAELCRDWQSDPNYSHGPLLPLLSIFLVVRALRRRRASTSSTKSLPVSRETWPCSSDFTGETPVAPQPAVTREPAEVAEVGGRDLLPGLATIVAALLLHGVAWLLNFALLDAVSLVGLILGLLLSLGGRQIRRDFGFPAILLLLAVPLPVAWYQGVALAMQQCVSTTAAALLAICGLPVYREGYIVHLNGLAMEVGAACNGMRQMTAFVALGAIFAHLAGRGRLYGALLLMLSAFTAVAANVLRILLTALILLTAGPAWAAGAFHTLEGLATLAIGAGVLTALALAAARLHDRWLLGRSRSPGASDGLPHTVHPQSFSAAAPCATVWK